MITKNAAYEVAAADENIMSASRLHFPDFAALCDHLRPALQYDTDRDDFGRVIQAEFGEQGFQLYASLYRHTDRFNVNRLRGKWENWSQLGTLALDETILRSAIGVAKAQGFKGPLRTCQEFATEKEQEKAAEREVKYKVVTIHDENVPPPRLFLVHDLIPANTVTGIAGDGGVGKSTLAMQLAAGVAGCRPWCGRLPQIGPALFISAEDDRDELNRRLRAIANQMRVTLQELRNLRLISLAGEKSVIAAPEARSNILKPTEIFEWLEKLIRAQKPKLVVLDSLADFFGGNENDRTQARQFISLLRGLAIHHECAVVLLMHPSLTGIATKTGASGSTGWNNSLRSRLFMDRVLNEDGVEPDPDARTLTLVKSNYAQRGKQLTLKYENGAFVVTGELGAASILTDDLDKADRVFLKLLAAYTKEGRNVSPMPSANYAPVIFARDGEAEGIKKKEFVAAMNRLYRAGKIQTDEFGPQSRRQKKIVAAIQIPPCPFPPPPPSPR